MLCSAISEFFGILILMYYNDHAPPHFRARYGDYEALFQISPLALLKGNLPPRASEPCDRMWINLSKRVDGGLGIMLQTIKSYTKSHLSNKYGDMDFKRVKIVACKPRTSLSSLDSF